MKAIELITLNGKDYMSVEDVNNEYVLKSKIDENKSSGITNLENGKLILKDACGIMAMGSCEVNNDLIFVKISIDYLQNALKSLSYLSGTKTKNDYVILGMKKEFPLLIGDINNNQFSGIFIAPRID